MWNYIYLDCTQQCSQLCAVIVHQIFNIATVCHRKKMSLHFDGEMKLINFLFLLRNSEILNSRKAELKCTCENTACMWNIQFQKTLHLKCSNFFLFNYGNMIQLIAKNGALVEWGINADFHFAIITAAF
jgi:hypothetical protein